MPHPARLATALVAATLAGALAAAGSPARAPSDPGAYGSPARPTTDPGATGSVQDAPRRARVERLLGALAHDSLEGRRTGTEGARKAAAFLASELERYGVEPGWAGGFLQPVPLVRLDGSGRIVLAPVAAGEARPAGEPLRGEANVVGIVRGSAPALRDEAVVLGAHFDHLGVGRPVGGDSIYNGADDDASGTVAVLEVARALAGRPARRSVVILLSAAEEQGLLGTYRYLADPAAPLDRTVVDLQVEMIGRPDPLAGGPGRAWLTGFERTTVGEALAADGLPVVADPRPEMGFFFRSDNLPFARAGIPAHTLSSYNLHEDYHTPRDGVDAVDFTHLTALVDAAEAAVRAIADGPRPEWKPEGREGLSPS